MLKRLLVGAVVALAMAACSAPMNEAPMQDRGEEGRAPAANGFEDALELEVVTDFLYPEQDYIPAENEMPVGLVLLTRGDFARNGALCDAFTKELRTYEEASAADPEADFLITYWLLALDPGDTTDCQMLRQTYDFDRAAAIKAQYGLQDATGPVFLAVDSAGNTIFLDLSDATPEATREAVDQWLKLALDASADAEDEGETAAPASRFSLTSFAANMKVRLLSGAGSEIEAQETTIGGRQFFAYNDASTGYRVGSTIRF